jgi:hypothetical protein
MLIGTHAVIYSAKPEADRKLLREVLGLRQADAGGGYVIFALPPGEASVHESGAANPGQELYLMCDDVKAFVASMERNRVSCAAVQDTGWGLLTTVKLPGGGKLGVYQPKHHRP